MSGLVSKVRYRIPFDQSELSISKIPPTDTEFKLSVGFGIESKPFDQSDRTNPNRKYALYRYTTEAVSLSANHVGNYKGDMSPLH